MRWFRRAKQDEAPPPAACARAISPRRTTPGSTGQRRSCGARDVGCERLADQRVDLRLLRGIEDGWFMSEIAEAAFQYQVALEKGDKKIVGVNVHTDSITHDLERFTPEERVVMIRDTFKAEGDRVEADKFSGLLVDYAASKGALWTITKTLAPEK